MDVFHLKHRPQTVAELDLPEVRQTIESILKSPQRSSCFLLAGPKGAGKTSAARILARALNCEKPKGIEPCNQCDNCREILKESSMDVVEIDGASNRGIDDIRQLKQRAYLLPAKLKYKVFIIDEVHMLTSEAFNALLKILEEPPEHTIFALCTTDPQKIPETVLSRLLRINFRRGSKEELLGSLERVLKREKIKMPTEAKEKMVAATDGSFRNLHKSLNQLVVEYGKDLSLKQVSKYLAKETGDYAAEQLEEDLAAGDVKKILARFEDLAQKGVDFSRIRLDYLRFFQKRLLTTFGVEKEGESLLSAEKLKLWLNLLIAAGHQEKEIDLPQLPLELAVVEFLGEGREVAGGKADGGTSKPLTKKKKLKKKESEMKAVSREITIAKKDQEKTETEAEAGRSSPSQTRAGETPPVQTKEIEKRWQEVLRAVKPYNHSVEAFMRSSRPKKVEGKTLVLEVFYPFHKQKLEENKNREIVEKGLAAVFNCPLIVDFELGKAGKKSEPEIAYTASEPESEEDKEKDMYDVAKEIFG